MSQSYTLPVASSLYLLASLTLSATEGPGVVGFGRHDAWPLWDNKETVADYGLRVGLPLSMALDLGNGVSLNMVLVPAGKFVMGVPRPRALDTVGFDKKKRVGALVFCLGAVGLLFLLGVVVARAIRLHRPPQYSLRQFVMMILAASLCVLGGMQWLHSRKSLAEAQKHFADAMHEWKWANADVTPAHEVTISTLFYIGQYLVTQVQYEQVMETNPSHFRGTNLPVETVSWNDAQCFCKEVNQLLESSRQNAQGTVRKWTLRLPTEAEWEFSCRAGTRTWFNTGDTEEDLWDAGWYSSNSQGKTHPVGEKRPNAWGIYDMHGNVWEWCQDRSEVIEPLPAVDPDVESGHSNSRVLRGGFFSSTPANCISTFPNALGPSERNEETGFRVVLAIAKP